MARVDPITRRAAWVVIATAVVASLALAKEFFIPVAVAILLSFTLAPVVRWLNRRIRYHAVSVTIACIFGTAIVVGVGSVAVLQFVEFADELPQHRQTISRKIIALRGTSDGVMGRFFKTMDDIEKDVSDAATTAPTANTPPVRMPAIPVVAQNETGLVESTTNMVKPVVEPLLMVAIVTVLVFLFLFYGEELRDRIVVLSGTTQLIVTAQALEEASSRIGRYLLMLTIINAAFGAAVWIGLMIIGLPDAWLLGLLAGMLRFVPVLGAWLGAAVPVLLAMAVFDGWMPMVWVATLFIVLEATINLGIEPYVYGQSTGISGIGVLVAILFWTWIWGPIGLLLAVPITVCLVVIGKFVEPLRVFYVLLSDEPMLAGERKLYHRLVAGDIPTAEKLVDLSIKNVGLPETADQLLLPVLATATSYSEKGILSDERLELIVDAVQDFVEDETATVDRTAVSGQVACAPASSVDIPAARVTAVAMARSVGQVVSHFSSSMQSDLIGEIEKNSTRVLALVAIDAGSSARARLLAKSLRRRATQMRIVILDPTAPAIAAKDPDAQITSVRTVVDLIKLVRQTVSFQPTVANAAPEPEVQPSAGPVPA